MMKTQYFSIFGEANEDIVRKIISYASKDTKKSMDEIVGFTLGRIAEIWRADAEAKALHIGWGEKYAQAIQIEYDGSKGKGSVFADGKNLFVGIVEKGIKTWSIKDALLRSKKAKVSRSGIRYIIVPFLHKASKSTGKSRNTSVIPEDVYDLVKTGIRLTPKQASDAGAPHLAGLQRYGGKQHGQYFTFRVVSEKSRGWQYPNKPATPIFKDVERKARITIDSAIRGYIERLIKGMGVQLNNV